METNREAIERLTKELAYLRDEVRKDIIAIENRIFALEALHVSPHDMPANLVNPNDLLGWTAMLYIAKHCCLDLRRENDLWYLSVHNSRYVHSWNSYENLDTMLCVARGEIQQLERC